MAQVILGGVFLVAVVLIVLSYERSEREGWTKFAAAHELTFHPGSFLLSGAYMAGIYHGHNLMIETFTQNKVTRTRIRLKARNSSPERRCGIAGGLSASPTSQEVLNLLIPNGPLGISGGKVEAAAGGAYLTYQQIGVMAEVDELRSACNLLSDILDGYSAVVAIGGAAVHPLEKIGWRSDLLLLSGVAIRIMKDIAQTTQRQLSDRAGQLLCPRCLVHCGAHRADLPLQPDVTYYGCRACYQSREFIDCPQDVVAVLDAAWQGMQGRRGGLLCVNWLARRALFDFDRVEIVRATDKDVEHFAMQVGNDTDPFRKPRYVGMRCSVDPACGLSENTLRVLESTFGRVETQA
jgi:hypothetical protein